MSAFNKILILFLAIGAGIIYKYLSDTFGSVPPPEMPLDQWWGDGEKPEDWQAYLANTSKIVSNKLAFPDKVIDDLRSQLNRTLRAAEPLEGIGFEYGFNSKYLQEVIDYWRDDYLPRWLEREKFLWHFDHFTTYIQGLRMHFLNLKFFKDNIEGKKIYTVLLLHGWPGSVREFFELIHELHNYSPKKKYIFNVVVPSLPGYGWSETTSKPGMGPAEIAVIMQNLMLRLGYTKYFIQCSDWGSVIGAHMATLFPKNVLGYHANTCHSFTPKSILKGQIASFFPSLFAPKEYLDFFFPPSEKFKFLIEESGYYHLQATKPDTIGIALTDNPIGLAAYILEKFSTWTNPNFRKLDDGGLTKIFPLDLLLDNLMIYYLTNSITTSQRLYFETSTKKQFSLKLDRVPTNVPAGCARFKNDIMHFLDFQMKDKFPNLIHSTYYKDGGHFAAMELPHVLYKDFKQFIQKVEKHGFV